jgi:organic radical activating enzyme
MEKISLNECIIELTRKCNMACPHCLRGEAENLDMKLEYIENLFKRVNFISTLTLTGGEPSLKPEIINNLVRLAKKHKVDIGNFYIATNGKRVTNEFILAVMNLYLYCSDNEVSQLEVSTDKFHDVDEKIKRNMEKLRVFKFTGVKHDIDEKYLINQGNASLNYGGRELSISKYDYDTDTHINEGQIYLNCKGNILPSCDLSYENQDAKNLILGNVMDENFDILESVKKFNEFLDKDETGNFKFSTEIMSLLDLV